MLPARNRLRSSADFALTVRRGVRVGQRTLVLHGLRVEQDRTERSEPAQPARVKDSPPVQVGFVVSRAVGNAVRRNRTKRRLRALMASSLDSLPAGARLVVRALPPAAEASGDALAQDLDRAVRRLVAKLS